jgi:hypothetical protein
VPIGTTGINHPANANVDDPNDIGNQAYVTGNSAGNALANDVDTMTVLTSPLMKLRSYHNPNVHYSIWFYNQGDTANRNGRLDVFLSNGRQTVLIDSFKSSHLNWLRRRNIALKNWLPLTDSMSLRFVAQDITLTRDFAVEAGLDAFLVTDGLTQTVDISPKIHLQATPNPFGDVLEIRYRFDEIVLGEKARLQVFDLSGREMYNQPIYNFNNMGIVTIPNSWQTGIYFAQMEYAGQLSRPIKVVKSQ